MPKLIKPGTDNQTPGKYREVGPRGGEVSKPRTVKIDKGDRLPPTQEKGREWKKNITFYPKHLLFGNFYPSPRKTPNISK